MKTPLDAADFSRIDSDINGNPRYYVPSFIVHASGADMTRRLASGLVKYRGKRRGPGYVLQSYCLRDDLRYLNETLKLYE